MPPIFFVVMVTFLHCTICVLLFVLPEQFLNYLNIRWNSTSSPGWTSNLSIRIYILAQLKSKWIGPMEGLQVGCYDTSVFWVNTVCACYAFEWYRKWRAPEIVPRRAPRRKERLASRDRSYWNKAPSSQGCVVNGVKTSARKNELPSPLNLPRTRSLVYQLRYVIMSTPPPVRLLSMFHLY